MPQSASLALAAAISLLAPCGSCVAQSVASAEQGVRAASKAYTIAAARGDFAAMAKMWTERGDYIDAAGNRLNAQQMLKRTGEGSDQPSAPDATSVLPPRLDSTLRMITPDVAIEDGKIGSVALASGERLEGRFTAVWVRRDGRWLLDSVREATAAAPVLSDKLMPLAWMLGDWAGETGDAALLISAHVSDGGNYIVREFLIQGGARESTGGVQRIGWDPESKRLKAWNFDSQGGSGEGYWRQEGENWVLDTTRVMPDGKKVTMTNVYSPIDGDRFVWESKPAVVDGVRLPSVRVEFHRAPEGP